MADKLINTNVILSLIDEEIAEHYSYYSDQTLKRIRGAIEKLPTVDAVPVRHGRWIPYNSKYGHDEKVYLCDQCNNNVGFRKMNFCPNCGARMDGNNEQTEKID